MSQPHPNNVYIQRVNLALDTIHANLEEDLSLEFLAQVAGFSAFHFHRVFKSVVGETLSQYVWRARIERGAMLLRSAPDMPISDVAAYCGFTSLAGFSRAFKQRFGLPPTRWITFEQRIHVDHLDVADQLHPVHVRRIPDQHLAYIRVYDSYSSMERITEAYRQLLGWYAAQGGDLARTTLYGMSYNDPEITPLPNCYFDWCLTIPDTWTGDANINVRSMPACDVVVAPMSGGDLDLESRLWQYLWQYWLPTSRYQPAELPAMEIYQRFPHEAGWWNTLYLECAIPVLPL